MIQSWWLYDDMIHDNNDDYDIIINDAHMCIIYYDSHACLCSPSMALLWCACCWVWVYEPTLLSHFNKGPLLSCMAYPQRVYPGLAPNHSKMCIMMYNVRPPKNLIARTWWNSCPWTFVSLLKQPLPPLSPWETMVQYWNCSYLLTIWWGSQTWGKPSRSHLKVMGKEYWSAQLRSSSRGQKCHRFSSS